MMDNAFRGRPGRRQFRHFPKAAFDALDFTMNSERVGHKCAWPEAALGEAARSRADRRPEFDNSHGLPAEMKEERRMC